MDTPFADRCHEHPNCTPDEYPVYLRIGGQHGPTMLLVNASAIEIKNELLDAWSRSARACIDERITVSGGGVSASSAVALAFFLGATIAILAWALVARVRGRFGRYQSPMATAAPRPL